MDGIECDPYSWDVGVVVKKLCTPDASWTRDTSLLAQRIQEEEIDGKTLLTFEHVCSRQELMDCLGIRIARHKAALVEAIVTLRSRSKGYWQWQQDFQRKQSICFNEGTEAPTPGATVRVHSPNLPNGDQQKENGMPGLVPVQNRMLPHALEKPLRQDPSIENHVHQPQEDPLLHPTLHPHQSPIHEPPDRVPAVDERSSKRRRVVPMLLTDKPSNIDPAFLPTEADLLDHTAEKAGLKFADDDSRDFPWENAPLDAYLGDGKILREDTITPVGMLSSLIREDEDTFAAVSLHRIPPARRLVANKTLKRLLTGRDRITRHSSRSPSHLSDQSDTILELADLDNELDPETLREIKEEELENEKLNALSDEGQPYPFVTPERIAEILNESIAAIEANWKEKKLPKYERKAYGLWQKSRRYGTKKQQFQHAYKTAKHLIDRIGKIRLEIQKSDWTAEAHYREAAKNLEQSLEDKMYQEWFMKMLESSKPPPKPQGVARPKPAAVRKPNNLMEELLTSSEEEDFIVPDDHMDVIEDGLTGDRHSPLDLMKEEPVDFGTDFVDLTQEDMDEPIGMGFDLTNAIDLTSPVKSANSPFPVEEEDFVPRNRLFERNIPETDLLGNDITENDAPAPHINESQPSVGAVPDDRNTGDQSHELPSETAQFHLPREFDNLRPPSIESFGDLQQLTSQSLRNYVKANDRWRLLIGEMWHMEHARRKSAVDLILSDHSNAVWNNHLSPYLDNPLKSTTELNQDTPKLVAFDVARLFHCFAQCQHTTEEQMLAYGAEKMNNRLKKACLKFWEPFCMFVEALIPHFPQDSQIYRQDADIIDDLFPEDEEDELDELDDDLEDEDEGRRRPKEKEIIRDKAAVDLRERENQRLKEQEARRKKLRETLASSSLVSGDKTRLIINESKEEDQSLIYIHEYIGSRIKDHQIDGVRFIWNQIVREPSLRQGCLLAHTMGLGKTMQVITVLVALAEAAQSEDPSVVAQIPKDLREPRILVLCPAALVDNWMDELLKWAPENLLGELRKVSANMSLQERSATVTAWASGKGVLTIGYNMFKKVLHMSEDLEDLMTNTPNVVVADEAHNMKNRDSKTNLACSRFRTNSRIALTGSPLSNSVLEYFAMIDWVAPNFLGPYSEFREIYAAPVERGLYHDSTKFEKRKAQMKLKALEQLVAPKVNRRTIAALKDELPPKQEFIIFVPPTEPQKQLYQLYIKGVSREGADSQAETFAAINHLGLICSHPRCFEAKVRDIQKGNLSSGDDEEETKDKSFPKSMIQHFLKALHSFPDLDTPTLSLKTELLTTILDEARKVNDKVLIFSQSLHTLDYLENMCRMQRRTICRLDGKTPVATRQEQTKDFNEGSKEVFLISTTAGGVGLNIQGANRVVIFDVRYNPMHEQQAVGRAYRIGQQKPVFVYRFMVAGTFEDNLHNKQVFKMQLASRVVDKKNPISWSKRKGDVVSEIRYRPATDLNPFFGKDHILDKLIDHRKNGEAIRSIVTTDTFEEEDLGAALTEEENKQVAEMIKLNHLRATDPDEYERTKGRVELMEQVRLQKEQEQLFRPSSLSQQSPHPSFDGTSDMPGHTQSPPSVTAPAHGEDTLGARKPPLEANTMIRPPSQQPTALAQGTAPMPMAGANTFFGEHRHSEPDVAQRSEPAATVRQQPPIPNQSSQGPLQPTSSRIPPTGSTHPAPLTSTPLISASNQELKSNQNPVNSSRPPAIFKQGGVFNVTEIPAKVEFERRLGESARRLQERNLPLTRGDPIEIAKSLTALVNQIRKKDEFGLLPDTRHWKVLNRLVLHEKFVIALISGYLSPEYVATTEEEVLEKRVETINELDEMEISARAQEKANSPDPNNIRRRSSHHGEKRSRATDDIKVMREAMDNRRNRAFRLPPWANKAFDEEKSRASPAMEIPERQFGFRDETSRSR
ncbi:hypothetical protein F53441_610 [Fusarium austroafricanum]|uniref:Uncharacterized protein n=1 Tax=Fusarium austroafricanum TaxID=2364996 RepID=A0A8H4P3A5_9HYPO|nr:hypothetical protein F53441_610 [Fusarium austroafricanum]